MMRARPDQNVPNRNRMVMTYRTISDERMRLITKREGKFVSVFEAEQNDRPIPPFAFAVKEIKNWKEQKERKPEWAQALSISNRMLNYGRWLRIRRNILSECARRLFFILVAFVSFGPSVDIETEKKKKKKKKRSDRDPADRKCRARWINRECECAGSCRSGILVRMGKEVAVLWLGWQRSKLKELGGGRPSAVWPPKSALDRKLFLFFSAFQSDFVWAA